MIHLIVHVQVQGGGYTSISQQVTHNLLCIPPPLQVLKCRFNTFKHEYRDEGRHNGHCDLPEAEVNKTRDFWR